MANLLSAGSCASNAAQHVQRLVHLAIILPVIIVKWQLRLQSAKHLTILPKHIPAPFHRVSRTPVSSPSQDLTKPQPSRPWVCPHPGCRQRDGRYSSFTRKADYQRHIDRLHVQSPQLFNCTYPGCNRTGFKGLPREDKLRDHLREVHKVDVPKVQGRGGQR